MLLSGGMLVADCLLQDTKTGVQEVLEVPSHQRVSSKSAKMQQTFRLRRHLPKVIST